LYGAHPIAKSHENPGTDRIGIDPKEKTHPGTRAVTRHRRRLVVSEMEKTDQILPARFPFPFLPETHLRVSLQRVQGWAQRRVFSRMITTIGTTTHI
jgi:hypothetical protein